MKRISTLILISGLTIAAPLSAANLSQNSRITNDLTAAAVGHVIRTECSSISANMFTAWSKAMSLKSYAKGLGATNDDIDAFLADKTEQNRIRGLATSYLKNAGAVEGNAESFCKVGNAEIAKGSLIGSLLRN